MRRIAQSTGMLFAAVVLVAAGDIGAAEVREVLQAEREPALDNPAYDILAVTVVAVDDAGATNANPPTVRLAIDAVIRGAARDGTAAAAWRAPAYLADLDAEGGVSAAWKSRPLVGPAVGDRLIVFANAAVEPMVVLAGAVYRDTPDNRAVADRLAFRTHDGRVLLGLLGGFLALTTASLVLFLRRAWWRSRPGQLAAVAIAAANVGLYAIYESGISPYASIRIDLLILWPMVGMTVLFGLFALWRLVRP